MEAKIEKLTKLDAARRQLNSAIRMYFNDEDPIAVHAVVSGSMEILTDLGKKKGMQLGILSGIHLVREERRAEIIELMRRPQNHIKHADRPGDEDKVLEYRPAILDFHIQMTVDAYERYTGESTPESRAFWLWFGVKHPKVLLESVFKQQILSYTDTFGSFEPGDKKLLLELVRRIRNEKKIPNTNYS